MYKKHPKYYIAISCVCTLVIFQTIPIILFILPIILNYNNALILTAESGQSNLHIEPKMKRLTISVQRNDCLTSVHTLLWEE